MKSVVSFSDRRIMVRELKRIRRVMETLGTDECIRFCQQGVLQYNRALSTGYGKSYGEELRGSIAMYCIAINEYHNTGEIL